MLTVLTALALAVAVVALVQARRSARQLARLTEMYWQLKYEHGELKATLTPVSAPAPPPVSAFVPLGAIKRNGP